MNTFTVTVTDPCFTTVIQLPFSTLANMSYTIAAAASTQTFALGTNSKAVQLTDPTLCGPIEYSITEMYSFVTLNSSTNPATISVQSNLIPDTGVYSATLHAKLLNYPSVTPVDIGFSITMINPCLTTTLNLPTAISAVTISALSGVGST